MSSMAYEEINRFEKAWEELSPDMIRKIAEARERVKGQMRIKRGSDEEYLEEMLKAFYELAPLRKRAVAAYDEIEG